MHGTGPDQAVPTSSPAAVLLCPRRLSRNPNHGGSNEYDRARFDSLLADELNGRRRRLRRATGGKTAPCDTRQQTGMNVMHMVFVEGRALLSSGPSRWKAGTSSSCTASPSSRGRARRGRRRAVRPATSFPSGPASGAARGSASQPNRRPQGPLAAAMLRRGFIARKRRNRPPAPSGPHEDAGMSRWTVRPGAMKPMTR